MALRQRCPTSELVSIRRLAIGTPADGIEAAGGLAWNLNPKHPDRIAGGGDGSFAPFKHQHRLCALLTQGRKTAWRLQPRLRVWCPLQGWRRCQGLRGCGRSGWAEQAGCGQEKGNCKTSPHGTGIKGDAENYRLFLCAHQRISGSRSGHASHLRWVRCAFCVWPPRPTSSGRRSRGRSPLWSGTSVRTGDACAGVPPLPGGPSLAAAMPVPEAGRDAGR